MILSNGYKANISSIGLTCFIILTMYTLMDFMFSLLRVEDVKRKNVLTNFWGMDFTTEKLRSLVRNWQTLIKTHIDVKKTKNFTSRTFCIRFTMQRDKQVKRTCYAQSSQILEVKLCLSISTFS
ncbi:hypothetical protein MKX03_025083 [Papaver bracteatum]|nr:hypothetical protein MKX03_025083 [Papaver bracteatum]